jgi:hypothetical protein
MLCRLSLNALPFELVNQLNDFHEILCEHCDINVHANARYSKYPASNNSITARQFVRWKALYLPAYWGGSNPVALI